MSDVELEHAGIAPLSNENHRRSICKRNVLPGGRYMVGFSLSGLGVWDLGYTSSAECKLIASIGPESSSFSGKVHATPEGMGLVIFSHQITISLFMRYIRKAKPLSSLKSLVLICSLSITPLTDYYISPDKMIWYDHHGHEIIFQSLGLSTERFSVLRDANATPRWSPHRQVLSLYTRKKY